MRAKWSHPVAIFRAFKLPEYDQGLMISKSVMIAFYRNLSERKTNLKYSLFRQLGYFLSKSRKNTNFKNHVKSFQLTKLCKPNDHINYRSITFCVQNCVSLPSSLFLKTGVEFERLSDNQLQKCHLFKGGSTNL